MDATLMISSPATPAPVMQAPPSASASGAAHSASGVELAGGSDRATSTPNGRAFAGLMRGLLPTHERQEVAAAPDAASTEAGELKTEVLGDQLNVITASNAQPDASSLSAFARAQGLDEAAVTALFGDVAAQNPTQTDVVATAAAMGDVAWLATQLSAEISLQVSPGKIAHTVSADDSALSGLPVPIDTVTDSTASPCAIGWNIIASALPLMTSAVSVANPTQTEGKTLSVAAQSGSGWAFLGLNSALSPTSALSAMPLTPAAATVPNAAAGLATAGLVSTLMPAALLQGATAAVNKPSLNTPIAATDALSLLAPANPSSQDAMRIRLVPAWSLVTQQLTQMSGTAMSSAWGALTASTLTSPTRSVVLDLSDPLACETEDVSSGASDGGWSSPTLEVNRPGAANAPLPGALPVPGMAQTLRQEHYQQLADRLGQAMAERLQSQIARGEWKLQMRLNPANLGRIDVELDMHAKGLDAVFRSENPLTRELMVQSMPKLKDTLSQSGMAVASVWVNSDAGRQSDGNPTPPQDRTEVSDTQKSAPADVGAVPATKAIRSTDGFDVLA